MNHKYLLYAIIIGIFCTCQYKKEPQNQNTISNNFRIPEIPVIFTHSQQKAEFLAEHYWDHFDFLDTTPVLNRISEKEIVDYLHLLNHLGDKEIAANSIQKTLYQLQINPKTYSVFLNIFSEALYNPNSSARNENLYQVLLESILTDSLSSLNEKEKARFDLAMIQKNQVGEVANNFKYKTPSGKTEKLHQINSDLVLLVFYNPDCHACSSVLEKLKKSTELRSLITNKQLTICLIYPDQDLSAWKNDQTNIPSNWINGYDPESQIKDNLLYDLKAIPTIYMLDKNKRVILKDADISEVEKWIFQHKQNLVTK